MISREKTFDNLKLLGDIGDKRQGFIRKELDVCIYQDLANLSEDKIAAAFQAAGKPISRKIIQRWIDGSKAKIQEADSLSWEWLDKIFVVEFRVSKRDGEIRKRQSRIYHMKVDKNGDWLDNGEKIPVPKQGFELYPWMLEQLGEQLQVWGGGEGQVVAEGETAVTPSPRISRLEVIEMSEIRIFDQTEPPAMLEVTFNLPELADARIETGTTFRVDFYTQTEAGCISIGDTDPVPLMDGKVAYTAQLPNATLPTGDYDLGAIVYIRSQPPSANYLEIHVQS